MGIENEARGLGLGASLGGVSTDALDVVGNLQRLRQEFGLSNQQSKEIAVQALTEVNASVGFFSGLQLTAEQIDTVRSRLAELAKERTAVARAAAAAEEAEIKDARAAQAAADKRLDTLDKINARLKTARKELGGLDPGSSEAKAKQEEIANLNAQTQSVKEQAKAAATAAEKIRKANEDAANASIKLADNFFRAEKSAKDASKSLKDAIENRALATATGSSIASDSAIRRDRDVLLADIQRNLQSGEIDPRRLASQYGLGFFGSGGFRDMGTVEGLAGLDINKLADISRATSSLADGQTVIANANEELKKTQSELAKLTEEVKRNNERESNLAITVPVGGQKQVYLP